MFDAKLILTIVAGFSLTACSAFRDPYVEPPASSDTATLIIDNKYFDKTAYVTEGKCPPGQSGNFIAGLRYGNQKSIRIPAGKEFSFGAESSSRYEVCTAIGTFTPVAGKTYKATLLGIVNEWNAQTRLEHRIPLNMKWCYISMSEITGEPINKHVEIAQANFVPNCKK